MTLREKTQIYPLNRLGRASDALWLPAGHRHSAVRLRWDLAAENLARVKCGLQCQAYGPSGVLLLLEMEKKVLITSNFCESLFFLNFKTGKTPPLTFKIIHLTPWSYYK